MLTVTVYKHKLKIYNVMTDDINTKILTPIERYATKVDVAPLECFA